MPQGLQLFDAAGGLIFDIGDQPVKLLFSFSIGASRTGAQTAGSITDPRLTAYAGHSGFVCAVRAGFFTDNGQPRVWIAGDTVFWAYDPAAPYLSNATYLVGIA